MTLEAYEPHVSSPELYDSLVKFVGGTAAVTKVHGAGITVSYVSTGIVDLVWKDNPGSFLGVTGYGFEATTHADLKGYTTVAGVFNTSTLTLRVEIFNSSFNLADLAALQWLTLRLSFKRTSV